MEKSKAQYGIIGFFDILGYQSFLKNNSPEYAANEVLSTLTSLDKQIPKLLRSQFNGLKRFENIMKEIKWLIFSDTILLISPYALKDDDTTRAIRWVIFIVSSIFLSRHMFEFGLPIRGVINAGEFVVMETCFAGNPIVEAYRLTNDLDLAACVFIKDSYDEFLKSTMKEESFKDPSLWERIIVHYLIPRKSGKQEKLHTLNFFSLGGDTFTKMSNDLRQTILNSFWKHNKDVCIEVQNKVTNTEQFLRFCKSLY